MRPSSNGRMTGMRASVNERLLASAEEGAGGMQHPEDLNYFFFPVMFSCSTYAGSGTFVPFVPHCFLNLQCSYYTPTCVLKPAIKFNL